MFTINITTKVDPKITSEWLLWQKEVHIPALMETGCFSSYRFHQLLEQDESDGKIFVLQLMAASKESHQNFINEYEMTLKNQVIVKWGEKSFEFRSLLQNID
ncbi:MAG: DUF4286 family protein [Ginsengibacter sp.]